MQSLGNIHLSQSALLSALRANLENDYDQDLPSSTIDRVCSLFQQIITEPLGNQTAEYKRVLRKNADLAGPIQFGMTRLEKYNGEAPLEKEMSLKEPGTLQPNYKHLTFLNVPDKLMSNRHFALKSRQVNFERGTYLGDGRIRVVQQFPKDPRLVELSKSIWLAERTPEKQYVWRAKVMADHKDVYKLLKFLTSDPSSVQSIHINTGGHGLGGQGAYDLNDPELSDPRIFHETQENICLLETSEFQLRNISMATQGSQNANVYPKLADHIIDTLCEGAKYMAKGNGLSQPLMFLWKGVQASATAVAQQQMQAMRISYPEGCFGPKEWEFYFGNVGEVPPLPRNIEEILKSPCPYWSSKKRNIEEILKSPCPYWSSKKIEDTHLLMLIPKTVNGKPFTINLLGEMIKRPQNGGHSTKYYSYDNDTTKEHGNKGVSGSYWALVTKDVIPNSRNKTFDEQRALLKSPYAVPGVLEMATAILMNHAKTGEKLYPDNPKTYTRCQEKVCGDKYRVVVGSFDSSGLILHILNSDNRYARNGLGGVRKFS